MATEQLTEPAIQATEDGAPKNEGTFISPDFEKRFNEAFQKDLKDPTIAEPTTAPPPATPPPAKPAAEKPVAEKPKGDKEKLSVPDLVSPRKEPSAEPQEEEVPTVIKSAKASEEWRKMKAAHKTELSSYQEKIKALEAEMAKAKPATAAPDLEVIKKENEQLSQIVQALNVEAHPKFKAYFDSKIKGVLDAAKRVGGEHGEQVAKVLQIHDPDIRNERLQAMYDELPSVAQVQIGALAVQLDQIQSERQTEIEKARENFSRISQENQAKAEASKADALRVFQENLKAVQDPKSGLSVFQPREGDAEWNKGVEERKRLAQEIFAGDMEVEALSRAALWAASAPAFLQNLVKYAEENEQLKAQIAELKAGVPTTEETGGEHPPADTTKGLSYEEGLLQRARQIQFQ